MLSKMIHKYTTNLETDLNRSCCFSSPSEQDHEEDLDSEMLDSTGHLITDGSDPNTILDSNSYHTLEVDDTELAEYPTHLALVLKRPRVGKNGLAEPDTLEETYAFVDLKYFMPISANKYIMKSHVNLVRKKLIVVICIMNQLCN